MPRKNKKEEIPFVPYEETHRLVPLTLTITVVNKGQGYAVEDLLHSLGSAVAFSCKGKGTATEHHHGSIEFYENTKRVVFGILREDKWPEFEVDINKRFSVSQTAKGISYKIPITAVAGISIYKMLSNLQERHPEMRKNKNDPKEEDRKMPENKVGYESIFAIVNSGYTDLVMTAAKGAGARGGTIISGRGTGNKDIEKFYGIEITPEKEIVIILVPSEIKDDVMLAINTQAGMNSKGQGIAFAMPVTGLVGISTETHEEKVDEIVEKTAA